MPTMNDIGLNDRATGVRFPECVTEIGVTSWLKEGRRRMNRDGNEKENCEKKGGA